MRDRHSHDKPVLVTGPAVLAADPSVAGVDLTGFQAAEIVIAAGVGGITFTTTNKIEIVATHSDDDSVYTPVTDADMLGVTGVVGGIIKSFVAAHAAAAVYNYGYVGGKKFLKVLPDFSGTHATGTPIAVIVNKSHPAIAAHVA